MTELNPVMVFGRLVRKPDIRTSTTGTALGSSCIAVNRYYRDKSGQPKSEAAFIPCTAFGRATVQLTSKSKGEPVLVVGRLKTDSWQAEGPTQTRLVLIAEEVRFISHSMRPGQPDAREKPATIAEIVRMALPF